MRAFAVGLSLAAVVVAQEAAFAPPFPAPAGHPSLADIGQLPYLEQFPYPWFEQTGFHQLACGYGHIRNAEGHCVAAAWYTFQGCHQTVLVSQTTLAVEQAHTVTVTSTVHVPTTIYETVTETDVKTKTKVETKTAVETQTVEKTKVWVSTETLDHTSTVEHTLTKKIPVTVVQTQHQIATVTHVQTVVQPTTFISTLLSTEVVDRTQTVVHTVEQTETQLVTQTVHDTATETAFVTKTETATDTVPVTVVSTLLSTVTEEGSTHVVTQTSVVVSPTVVEKIWTKTETQIALATVTAAPVQQQAVQCIKTCKQNFWPNWTPTIIHAGQSSFPGSFPVHAAPPQFSVIPSVGGIQHGGAVVVPGIQHGGAVVVPGIQHGGNVVVPQQGNAFPIHSPSIQPVHSGKKRGFSRERV